MSTDRPPPIKTGIDNLIYKCNKYPKEYIMKKEIEMWVKRRWARFETSGCSLCWYYCSHDNPSPPPNRKSP